MEMEFPIAGEQEQFTAMVEDAADVVREAIDALECWGARPELETKLKTVWFELHQTADPHCTCNDCLYELGIEDDGSPLGTVYTLPPEAREPEQLTFAIEELHGAQLARMEATAPYVEDGHACGPVDANGVCSRCGTDFGRRSYIVAQPARESDAELCFVSWGPKATCHCWSCAQAQRRS